MGADEQKAKILLGTSQDYVPTPSLLPGLTP